MMFKIRSRFSWTTSIIAPSILTIGMMLASGCNENNPTGSTHTDPLPPKKTVGELPVQHSVDPQHMTKVDVRSNARPTVDVHPASADVVAMVKGKPITRQQLVEPLIESYGLNYLLQLIQLELAIQHADEMHIVIGPAEIQAENDIMVKGFFPDAEAADYTQLLSQLLGKQNITASQWQLLLQINSRLRKIAEPMCRDRITDENLKQAFDVHYGALAKIRLIQISNMTEALTVQRRINGGEKFEDVARALSQDQRTAALGGEFPAFPANSTNVNLVIRDNAFNMKPGEVSDPINTDGKTYIIKLEERIAPRVAKFNDETKATLRKLLTDRLVVDQMKSLKLALGSEAQQQGVMVIQDPVLKKQFEEKVKEHEDAVRRAEEENKARTRPPIDSEIRKRIFGPTRKESTQPTTQPATQPAGQPGLQPSSMVPPHSAKIIRDDSQRASLGHEYLLGGARLNGERLNQAIVLLPVEAPYRPPATWSGDNSTIAPDGNI